MLYLQDGCRSILCELHYRSPSSSTLEYRNHAIIAGKTAVRRDGRDTQAEVGNSEAGEPHPRAGGVGEGEPVAPVPRAATRPRRGSRAAVAAAQSRRRRHHGPRRGLNRRPRRPPLSSQPGKCTVVASAAVKPRSLSLQLRIIMLFLNVGRLRNGNLLRI